MPSDRNARPGDAAEATRFLADNPDIAGIQLVLTDPSGVARGKSVRRHELERVYAHGRYLPGSILSLDITGADVEETGLVWDDGDADRCCRPVPGTLVRAPWHAEPTAQALLTMHELDGAPSPADPRHVLARVVERFAPLGLSPVAAVELEFYLLDRAPGPDGRPRPAASPVSGRRPAQLPAYWLDDLDDMAPVLQDVFHACAVQGIPAETLIAEYSPGQFEIVLRHRADALRAADEAVMYKRLVRGVAGRHGIDATFMAKPFAERAGSGMHLHVSLQTAGGDNAFAAEDPAGGPLLRHAVGGMMAMMAESMAVFAPNANSYRRFRRNSYAPTTPGWGVNNRSVPLRVPAGPPASRHVEHRVAGADANPYLVLAAVLAGMHHGIVNRLDPGPPLTGNAYARPAASPLPLDWLRALDAFAASGLLKDYFGARFCDVFLAIKRAEAERFSAQVSDVDYAWYLRTA